MDDSIPVLLLRRPYDATGLFPIGVEKVYGGLREELAHHGRGYNGLWMACLSR